MPRGGQRRGAGRPMGTGKYDKPTKTMRVPVDMQEEVALFLESRGYSIPLFSSRVPAGQPSMAEEHIEEHVNLARKLVPHPNDVFTVYATGESMLNAGIHDGDLLIVDRHIEARNKKIVLAAINGQVTVKTLHIEKGKITLMPANENYQPIPITEDMDFRILGVVIHAIRSFE